MSGNTKRELTLRERYFFVIEKYVEDVKQGQEVALDLLELIISPTDPVKEELRKILLKLIQFRPKITEIRVSTSRMSGKSTDSRRRPTQPSRPKSLNPF